MYCSNIENFIIMKKYYFSIITLKCCRLYIYLLGNLAKRLCHSGWLGKPLCTHSRISMLNRRVKMRFNSIFSLTYTLFLIHTILHLCDLFEVLNNCKCSFCCMNRQKDNGQQCHQLLF